MTPLAFERQYSAEWAELERLLEATRHPPGWASLQADSGSALRLTTLYRRACGHLVLARDRSYPAHIVDRLDRLTAVAHQTIYGQRDLGVRQLANLAATAFPAAVRRNWRYVMVATLAFAVPTIVLGLLVYARPELILSVVSSERAAEFEEMYAPTAQSIGRSRDASADWVMFGFYIRNNIGVAFQCFAGGLFGGLGSLLFLAYNGAFAGALAGYLTDRGLSGTFYPFVATHSAFELTAIVVSGAAGLKIGHALLAPGRLTRTTALVHAAQEASVLVYGVTAMLVVAAAVEAFWSSARWLPATVKFTAAVVCWASVFAYFGWQGRRAR